MIKYFSMFSGIGGFEKAIQKVFPDAQCVGFSEIDKCAVSIYKRHFKGHKNYGDATKLILSKIPDFDCLVSGFPCQAFSIAGKRGGFRDTRGTLFFEIARVLREKQPRFLVFENVKGLLSHDKGNSVIVIMSTLDELGYDCQWNICNSKNYGVPQNRERIFIVGHLRASFQRARQIFSIRIGNGKTTDVSKQENISTTITARHADGTRSGTYIVETQLSKIGHLTQLIGGSQGNRVYDSRGIAVAQQALSGGIGAKTGLYAIPSFTKHGVLTGMRIRKLMPVECERLQGFPDNWTQYGADGEKISDSQRYKCCGNAVTVNVVTEIFNNLIGSNTF